MSATKNEVGNRYGKLVVVERVESDSNYAKWRCECDCGGEYVTTGNRLRTGDNNVKSCLMCKAEDITGKRFNKLLVICKVARRMKGKSRHRKWLCLCNCGGTTITTRQNLRGGHTNSCGCYAKKRAAEAKTSHGMSRFSLFQVWRNMKSRCENPDNPWYELYSAKGREVCDKWKHNPKEFIDWANVNGWSSNLQLDRRDNSQGYSPENCRFVTPQVNTHNSDRQRRNKTGYTGVWYDKRYSTYISYITGIDVPLSRKRKHLGSFFTAEQAVTTRNNYIKEHNLPHQIQEIKG